MFFLLFSAASSVGSPLPCAQKLGLARTIPKSTLVDGQGECLFKKASVGGEPEGDYGFLWSGKAIYFGRGSWVYDMASNTLSPMFPGDLHEVALSQDGNLAFGYTKDDALWRMEGRTQQIGKLGTINGPVRGWFRIHPSNTMVAEWDTQYRSAVRMDAINFVDARTGKRIAQSHPGWEVLQLKTFTADGLKLVVFLASGLGSRLFDMQTMKLLKPEDDEPTGDVYNCDASWVAGGYAGGSTFIWNRNVKSFIWENRPIWDSEKVNHVWKDTPYGLPSAFSPNDQFLLCEGVVVKSATGEAVFRGLKGHRGKFSPDGRSLVTLDDEAFYIYTLPKDSEPIFGVFQKPKPWSLPKAKVKGKGKTR